MTGHQKFDESPFCLNDGKWILHNNTYLDSADVLNLDKIDRHYCVTMDVNRDGRDDVLCNVGASKGMGEGFNELYITQPDGSLLKIQVCRSRCTLFSFCTRAFDSRLISTMPF